VTGSDRNARPESVWSNVRLRRQGNWNEVHGQETRPQEISVSDLVFSPQVRRRMLTLPALKLIYGFVAS